MWLSWLDHCPIDEKFAGSISSQGTYLHYGFSVGVHVEENWSVFLSHWSLSLLVPSSLSKINKYIFRWGKKHKLVVDKVVLFQLPEAINWLIWGDRDLVHLSQFGTTLKGSFQFQSSHIISWGLSWNHIVSQTLPLLSTAILTSA